MIIDDVQSAIFDPTSIALAPKKRRCASHRPIPRVRRSRSAVVRSAIRKIAERTVAGLLNALDACSEIFKPAECANYFKACGYDTG